MVTVKFLQGWKGSLNIAETATMAELVAALNDAASLRAGDVLSMIMKGKRVDPSKRLAETIASLGIVAGTSIMLVLRSPEERAAAAAQDERAAKMREVGAAAAALSERVGLGPIDGGGYEVRRRGSRTRAVPRLASGLCTPTLRDFDSRRCSCRSPTRTARTCT